MARLHKLRAASDGLPIWWSGVAAEAQRVARRENQGRPLNVTIGPISGLGRMDVGVPYAELGAATWHAERDIRATAPEGSVDVVSGSWNCR